MGRLRVRKDGVFPTFWPESKEGSNTNRHTHIHHSLYLLLLRRPHDAEQVLHPLRGVLLRAPEDVGAGAVERGGRELVHLFGVWMVGRGRG